MLTETRRPAGGRTALGILVAGAALSLTACGPLPLLPPALSGEGEESASPAPEPEATQVAESEPEPEPEPRATISSEPEPTESGDDDSVGVFDLEEGDCINEVGQQDNIVDVPMVDCSDPHDYEVYVNDDLDADDEYPGDQEVSDMTAELCNDEFEDFVGTDSLESELEFTSFFPTPTSWDIYDNRAYLCLVYDPAGPVEGTLEDSGR